jgi:hypothetical protein
MLGPVLIVVLVCWVAVVLVGLGLCWASARGDRALLSGVKLWGRRRPRRLREEHENLRKTSGTSGRNSRR